MTPDEARAAGFDVPENWTVDGARRGLRRNWQATRASNPSTARKIRREVRQARRELAADLDGIDPANIERVGLAILARLAAMQVSLGADHALVALTTSVFALAATSDDFTRETGEPPVAPPPPRPEN